MTTFSCLCGSRGGDWCFQLDIASLCLFCSWHTMIPHGWRDTVKKSQADFHVSTGLDPLDLYDPFCISITGKNSCSSHLGLLPSAKEDAGISALVSAQAHVHHLWVQSLPSTGCWWLGMLSDGRYEAKVSFQYDLMLCFFQEGVSGTPRDAGR